MFCRISRSLVTAAALPFALGVRAASEQPTSPKPHPPISNLSKYHDLIVLPGSANPQLAKDVAAELGVELGRMETAR